jgi:hypothetical protein
MLLTTHIVAPQHQSRCPNGLQGELTYIGVFLEGPRGQNASLIGTKRNQVLEHAGGARSA